MSNPRPGKGVCLGPPSKAKEPIIVNGQTLVIAKTMEPVLRGSYHKCFEGSFWQIIGGHPGQSSGRVGRVHCQSNLHSTEVCSFYPSVFKMGWVR